MPNYKNSIKATTRVPVKKTVSTMLKDNTQSERLTVKPNVYVGFIAYAAAFTFFIYLFLWVMEAGMPESNALATMSFYAGLAFLVSVIVVCLYIFAGIGQKSKSSSRERAKTFSSVLWPTRGAVAKTNLAGIVIFIVILCKFMGAWGIGLILLSIFIIFTVFTVFARR